MSSHRGSFGNEKAVVVLEGEWLTLESAGLIHGPRSVRGSVTKDDLKGRAWIIGLGSARGRFVPESPEEFNRDLARSLVGIGGDIGGLFRAMFEMSPSIDEGVSAVERALDGISAISRITEGDEPDFTKTRESFDRMRRQHADFLQYFAPRGWAHCRILESPWRNHVIAAKFREVGGEADAVDSWLADRVFEHLRSVSVVDEIARCPVKAVWQWAFVAGEAALATQEQLWGPGAFAWLVIAEGMWRDLGDWSGGASFEIFKKKGVEGKRIREILTLSQESLVVSTNALSRSVGRTYLEPVDPAPTSRHALLHGRVAGIVRKVHAAKAVTVVDAVLEQVESAIGVVGEDELEPPPWA